MEKYETPNMEVMEVGNDVIATSGEVTNIGGGSGLVIGGGGSGPAN